MKVRAIYENDIIAGLGDISGMRKLLYVALWSRADPIGVVQYNTQQMLALTGILYQREDFEAFGNRLIFLNDVEMLLTRYLQTTVGTLSPKNRNQTAVWKLLFERWKATKDNPEPFFAAWKELKISLYAPLMEDAYTGEDTLCPRVAEFREKLRLCLTVDTPPDWSHKIASTFKQYIRHRVEEALQKTSKADTDKFRLVPSQVMSLQEIVGDMVNDKVPEKRIIQQIRSAINNNYKSIFTA
jgi:hypothetical protein